MLVNDYDCTKRNFHSFTVKKNTIQYSTTHDYFYWDEMALITHRNKQNVNILCII